MGCEIVVENRRDWFGNPRLGAFVVYVDGKRAGAIQSSQVLRSPCTPGRHVVRIRQWWFGSPSIAVETGSAGSVHLFADGPITGGFVSRFVTAIFSPGRALRLGLDGSSVPAKHDRRWVQRGIYSSAALMFVFALVALAIVGVALGIVCIVSGIGILVAGRRSLMHGA